jgi:hypothetical protein
MEEVKLVSKHPDLKTLVEGALAAALQSTEAGIQSTEKRLREFESKYELSTEEFLRRFNNDEFQHSFDFDEWIGEAWMLESLLKDKDRIKEIEFVD